MKNEINEIYELSVKLYYEVADDRMRACGHPGVMGRSSDKKMSPEYGKIMGAITTLQEIANKIKNNGVD